MLVNLHQRLDISPTNIKWEFPSWRLAEFKNKKKYIDSSQNIHKSKKLCIWKKDKRAREIDIERIISIDINVQNIPSRNLSRGADIGMFLSTNLLSR